MENSISWNHLCFLSSLICSTVLLKFLDSLSAWSSRFSLSISSVLFIWLVYHCQTSFVISFSVSKSNYFILIFPHMLNFPNLGPFSLLFSVIFHSLVILFFLTWSQDCCISNFVLIIIILLNMLLMYFSDECVSCITTCKYLFFLIPT